MDVCVCSVCRSRQVTNPFAQEELFEVRVDDPFNELHLVTDAEEWRYLREVCVGGREGVARGEVMGYRQGNGETGNCVLGACVGGCSRAEFFPVRGRLRVGGEGERQGPATKL